MQTFLPYPDFRKSLIVLDSKRLGKQRLEVLTILKTLAGDNEGWKNHPAVLMWKGHELVLVYYGICACEEWTRRGYEDNLKNSIKSMALRFPNADDNLPFWYGDQNFHYSHQCNLVRKDPKYYKEFFPTADPTVPYWWPTEHKIRK